MTSSHYKTASCPSVDTKLLPTYCNTVVFLIQDELATTKRSYEDQLSMMSDHLCSMNETLSKQREEIDTLKLGSKVPHRQISVFDSSSCSQVCFQLSQNVSK